MSISIGSGERGEGGTPADSTDTPKTNYIDNRSLFDYSIPVLTTDQGKLTPVDLETTDDGFETDQYFVVATGTDFLFVNQYVSGERQDSLLQVSIPFTLRRSFWEGKTFNGWTYSFTDYGSRVRVNETFGTRVEEHLWPLYQPGEVIYATRSVTADGNSSLLVDVNDAGRTWIPYSPTICLVKGILDDILTCHVVGYPDDTFAVAKPETLRRTNWDTETVQGITYAYTSSQTRTASQAGEDDEDQLIIPPYIADRSEILVSQLPISLSVGPAKTSLFDLNADGRAWAKAPE